MLGEEVCLITFTVTVGLVDCIAVIAFTGICYGCGLSPVY